MITTAYLSLDTAYMYIQLIVCQSTMSVSAKPQSAHRPAVLYTEMHNITPEKEPLPYS